MEVENIEDERAPKVTFFKFTSNPNKVVYSIRGQGIFFRNIDSKSFDPCRAQFLFEDFSRFNKHYGFMDGCEAALYDLFEHVPKSNPDRGPSSSHF